MTRLLTRARSLLIGLLPEWLKVRGRRARRRARLRRIAASSPNVSPESLASAFQALGVRTEGVMFIHSGSDWFRTYPGGVFALLEWIRSFANDSTVMMPAFPFEGMASEYLATQRFDVAKSSSRMGLLTELFRRTSGVRRSLHPTHSVCAEGRRAETLTCEHHEDVVPFGPKSPFAKLAAARGQILLLGVGIDVLTQVHATEDAMGDAFPLRVYLPQVVETKIVADGRAIPVRTRVHDPRMSRRKNIIRFEPRLEALDILRRVDVGGVTIRLVEAAELDAFLVDRASAGETIYV
jgi:aminoglycoside 3-N-acetyltransferase